MKKIVLFSLSLLIPLVAKSMGNPEETKKATKLEEFQQLPELPRDILNKEILLRFLYSTAQNDSLINAIQNIRSLIKTNKEWEKIINTEEMTNKLVDMMLENPKIKVFFNKIDSWFTEYSVTGHDEFNKRIFLLIMLETKQAKDIVKKLWTSDYFWILFLMEKISSLLNQPEFLTEQSNILFLIHKSIKYLSYVHYRVEPRHWNLFCDLLEKIYYLNPDRFLKGIDSIFPNFIQR